MRIIKKVKFRKYPKSDTIIQGKHCMIAEFEEGKILKIFTAYPQEDFSKESLNEFHWGDYPTEMRPQKKWCRLPEATIIQNICWMHNLAPRVFEIIGVELEDKKYFAQVIEDLGIGKTDIEEALKVYNEVILLGVKLGFKVEKEDVSEKDVMFGKLVDFNTFHFMDDHIQRIKDAYSLYSKYGKIYYQAVPEWEMNSGPRKSLDRVKDMNLEEIDFKGKSVMDLGCAGGFFCRYAKSRGADEVLGIDFEDCIGSNSVLAAKLVVNELGYWDINFKEMDLRTEIPPKADIVFFLSMNYHIGIPEWLPEVTNKLCIFEDNARGQADSAKVRQETLDTLNKMFNKVELVGQAFDHGDKNIYRCWK